MVPTTVPSVVSAQFRFISFCFAQTDKHGHPVMCTENLTSWQPKAPRAGWQAALRQHPSVRAQPAQ